MNIITKEAVMKKLLALMVAMIMVFGLASFAVALETHHPAKKDNDGRISKPGKSIAVMYVTDWVSEGDTSDAWETTIGVVDPTADRTINFPNASGTVALTGDISSSMTLADTKILVGQSTGLAAEKVHTLTGPITGTMTNAATIATSVTANAMGTAEINVSFVNVPIVSGQTSGAATVTAGSTILGIYPFANIDSEVANIVSI